MSSKLPVMLVALAPLLMASCGKPGSSGERAASAPAPRQVQVASCEVRPMERVVRVTGTLAAHEQSMLSAKVAGRLVRLAVDLGSRVEQGALIAQIEPRDYELRLEQAEAALSQTRAALGLGADARAADLDLEGISTVKEARAVLDEAAKNLQRVRDLSTARIASAAELDASEAAHAVARTRYDRALDEARVRLGELAQRTAEVAIARKQLSDTDIQAPFDGAIQARPASPGEYLAVGAPIVSLVKTDPLRLRLEVPERESALVQAGQAVRLHIEGDTNFYGGRIARISPALDEANRMLLVEADVPGRGALRPGLFARAEIVVNEREDAMSVPENAIVTFAGLEKVVLVQDGKALEKTVMTGRRQRGWVEIVSGLESGGTVILNPGGLSTGQPVAITAGAEGAQQGGATVGAVRQ